MRRALEIVVDLVNSVPRDGEVDALSNVKAVHEFMKRHDINSVTLPDQGSLEAILMMREQFSCILSAGDDHAAAPLLNKVLAAANAFPRLTLDGPHWRIQHFAPGQPLTDYIAANGGTALVHLITEREWGRLRRCQAGTCTRFFVDVSRNRSRRYCDGRACGNRLHVAAYRARRRNTPVAADVQDVGPHSAD
ncbi:CGNR zinc finger domain-containing protein [Streptomyces sp. NPDC001118]